MDHSITVFLAAIGIVAGFMIASIFAYLTFRLDDSKTINHLNLMRLGLAVVLIFSMFFSFSMDWLVGGLGLNTDTSTILGLGIFLGKLVLAVSSSLLGYILTRKAIKNLERSENMDHV